MKEFMIKDVKKYITVGFHRPITPTLLFYLVRNWKLQKWDARFHTTNPKRTKRLVIYKVSHLSLSICPTEFIYYSASYTVKDSSNCNNWRILLTLNNIRQMNPAKVIGSTVPRTKGLEETLFNIS